MTSYLYLLTVLVGVIAIAYGYIAYLKRQHRKQQQEIEFIKKEAKEIAEELENAKQAKKITESNNTLSSSDVDEQLQSKGYFRNESNGM